MKRLAVLGGVIALGIVSRLMPLGFALWDKYLGDALYAAMVYCVLALFWRAQPMRLALASMAALTAIEAFQLTGVAREFVVGGNVPLKLLGRLMGAEFAWLDLAAYLAGIASAAGLDLRTKMTG